MIIDDELARRMAWCLRCYKNAVAQGRPIPTDVEATAKAALRDYDALIAAPIQKLAPDDTSCGS